MAREMLSQNDKQRIDSVLDAASNRFDFLVRESGLNPEIDFKFSDLRGADFRGADLRGFNFSGSDLRGVLRDDATIVDGSTSFVDALLDWIHVDRTQIVTKMQEVEACANSVSRMERLGELVGEFGLTPHVVRYLVEASRRADSIEALIDFCIILPEDVGAYARREISDRAVQLLEKKFRTSASRTGRRATTGFSVDKIEDRLSNNRSGIAHIVYQNLAKIAEKRSKSVDVAGFVTLEERDVLEAFRLLP